MSAGGVMPSGSSRSDRLDPFALPVKFRARDAAADGNVRVVELDRERVVVRRAVRGMRMKVSLPVADFLGVAIRVMAPEQADGGAVAIMLEHRDAALAVPLYYAPDGEEAVAEWQLWARVLGLPLLIADADGTLHEPFRRLGALRIEGPQARRRRSSALKRRRPRILMRRKSGQLSDETAIHREEREIIARN
ncbi:MAG: DUF6101 family protein [Xanthobacteraceae bacterium]